MKVYREGYWHLVPSERSVVYIPAGEYEPGVMLSDEERQGFTYIDTNHLSSLIEFLDKEGYIKPRLDTRLREEDLKITHRLLDLLEKEV